MFFLVFQHLKNYTLFLKKKDDHKLYQALFICKKLAAGSDGYFGWWLVKNLIFSYKGADFSVIVNI